MPRHNRGICSDPPRYAEVATDIRNPDGTVIPARTVVEVELTVDMPRVRDPHTGVRARVPLILLDPIRSI